MMKVISKPGLLIALVWFFLSLITIETIKIPKLITLNFELDSPKVFDTIKVYYNSGGGFNENESAKESYNQKEGISNVVIPLPKKRITNIRIHPLTQKGELRFNKITITNTAGEQLVLSSQEILDSIQDPFDIDEVSVREEAFYVRSLSTNPFFYFKSKVISFVNETGKKNVSLWLYFFAGIVSIVIYKLFQNKKIRISTFKKEEKEKWVYLLSILITITIGGAIVNNSNLDLTNFVDRTIGSSALFKIDTNLRTSIYVGLIIFSIILFFVSKFSLERVNRLLTLSKHEEKQKDYEKLFLFFFSLAGLTEILLYTYTNNVRFLFILSLFWFLIFYIFSLWILRRIFYDFDKKLFSFFGYSSTILGFFLPLIIVFSYWILMGKNFTFGRTFYLIWIVISVVFYFLSLAFLSIVNKIKTSTFRNSLVIAFIPLILIPISVPFSNELQFTLSETFVDPQVLSSRILFFLFLISIFLFIFSLFRKKTQSINSKWIINNIFFPVLIATSVLFLHYKHFLTITTITESDFLHNGEDLIPTQQLFNFGSIPFIDLYPTHGLSSMISQVIYSLINGYRLFEPWLYNWFIPVIESVLLFFFLGKVINPFYSFLVVLTYPAVWIVNKWDWEPYITLLFPVLAISLISKRLTWGKTLLFWIICYFMLFWKLSFGVAILGAVVFLLTVIFLNKYFFSSNQDLKSSLGKIIFSFLGVGLGIFLIMTILAITRNRSVIDIVLQNIQFLKYQAPLTAYKIIVAEYSPLVALQYIILPAISAFYISYFLFHMFKRKKYRFQNYQIMLVTLAIISLILSVRSVQRHSLAEIYNPYFFVLLGFCLPFYINNFNQKTNIMIFNILFVSYLFIFPSTSINIKAEKLFEYKAWKKGEERVSLPSGRYQDAVRLINQEIKDDQTFFDIINSPLFYVLANKRFVPYFVLSLYYSSEQVQQNTLERLAQDYNQKKLPIILLRLSKTLDAVPNEVRHYRITEFIYKNYRPYLAMEDLQFWADISLKKDIPKKIDTHQEFDMMWLPYVWGNYDPLIAKEQTKIQIKLLSKSELIKGSGTLNLYVKNDIEKSKGNYIHFRLRAKEEGKIKLILGEKETSEASSLSFNIKKSNQLEDYMVRISTLWEWVSQPIMLITITPTEETEIDNIFIREGD